MKRFILPLLLLFSSFTQVQSQTITRALYQVDAAGNKLAGALVLPNDYNTTTDSLILMLFNHGKDESGDGTTATLGDPMNGGGVFANGSPLTVAGAAAGPLTAGSPTTGKTYRFAMFALQGVGVNTWCAQAAQVDYVVINTLLKKYRILKKGIVPIGLSAGGETTWEMLAGPNAALYSGAVPMSTPGIWGQICDFTGPANNFTKVWAFCGAQDGGQTDPINTIHAIGYLDAYRKGLTRLTLYTGTHCCWDTKFAPSYRENVTYYYNGVKATKSIDIYEFAAACVSGPAIVFDTASGVPPPPATTTALKAIGNISVNGNSVTFDASGSTGNIGSYDWYVTTAAGAYVNLSSMGLIPGSKILTAKLPNGSYIARLTIQDLASPRDAVTMPFSVNAIAGPTVVATFTIQGVTYNAYSDHTWK